MFSLLHLSRTRCRTPPTNGSAGGAEFALVGGGAGAVAADRIGTCGLLACGVLLDITDIWAGPAPMGIALAGAGALITGMGMGGLL